MSAITDIPLELQYWDYETIAKVTGEPRSGESSTEGAMSTAVLGATRPGKE